MLISVSGVASAATCSYCGSAGQLVCQGDHLYSYDWCWRCGNLGIGHYASHHFVCSNGLCQAVYYYSDHQCWCENITCGYTCPY